MLNGRDVSFPTDYPQFQLHRALRSAAGSEEAKGRDRAAAKANDWKDVIAGMVSGILRVGSREAVQGVPVWLTLRVLTGGFATGKLAAAGAWLDFEKPLLKSVLGHVPPRDKGVSPDRTPLNAYFVGDEGFESLMRLCDSGRYEIHQPEEGALLVVAWLAKNGYEEESQQLLEVLVPHFAKVRFYPRPSETAQAITEWVFLESVREVLEKLDKIKTSSQILTQLEAIRVWESYRDKLIRHLLQHCSTGRGDEIRFTLEAHHAPAIAVLVNEYSDLRREFRRCQKPFRKDSLAQIVRILEGFLKSQELGDQKRNRLEALVGRSVAKRGRPDSKKYAEYCDRQRKQNNILLFEDVSKIVIHRLGEYYVDGGIEDVATVSRCIDRDEVQGSAEVGKEIPHAILKKLRRAELASPEALVEKGIIKSGDSLAVVLPQITCSLGGREFDDSSLGLLYSAIYRAFRQRRSLLLLNYEHQVQLEELPWLEAIQRFRTSTEAGVPAAMLALRRIASLAMTRFPQAIVPNKLLQEFRAIAKMTNVEMPLVDELAADIFMGGFTNKFARAAQIAGELLQGTLYEKYYQIDYARILEMKLDKGRTGSSHRRRGAQVAKEFSAICQERAKVVRGRTSLFTGSYVVENAMVIEQQQVLTTQNLAIILCQAGLTDELESEFSKLAEKCFRWILKTLTLPVVHRHDRLIKIKNSAYAWRQMVVYISLTDGKLQRSFVAWAKEQLMEQDPAFARNFGSALVGLENAMDAHERREPLATSHSPFYGWTMGKHWLLTS